jgi:hypothetical protein
VLPAIEAENPPATTCFAMVRLDGTPLTVSVRTRVLPDCW